MLVLTTNLLYSQSENPWDGEIHSFYSYDERKNIEDFGVYQKWGEGDSFPRYQFQIFGKRNKSIDTTNLGISIASVNLEGKRSAFTQMILYINDTRFDLDGLTCRQSDKKNKLLYEQTIFYSSISYESRVRLSNLTFYESNNNIADQIQVVEDNDTDKTFAIIQNILTLINSGNSEIEIKLYNNTNDDIVVLKPTNKEIEIFVRFLEYL